MRRPRLELLLPLLLLLGGCGLRPEATRDWVEARVPAGASILAEGPSGEALTLLPDDRPVRPVRPVRAVRSVALLSPVDVRSYDFVLLDSRIYALDVRKGRPRALLYRAVARDPELEPVGILEARALRRTDRLLLLRRRTWLPADLSSVSFSPAAAGGSAASLTVPARRGYFRLRTKGGASPPGLRIDGAPVAWGPHAEAAQRAAPGDAVGARVTPVIELLRGEHRLELEAGDPVAVERLLAAGRLRQLPVLAGEERLLGLLAARGVR